MHRSNVRLLATGLLAAALLCPVFEGCGAGRGGGTSGDARVDAARDALDVVRTPEDLEAPDSPGELPPADQVLLLDWVGEDQGGAGTEAAPFQVESPVGLRFTLVVLASGPVATSPDTVWDVSDPGLDPPWPVGEQMELGLPEGYEGVLSVGALHGELVSTPPRIWFQVTPTDEENEPPTAILLPDPEVAVVDQPVTLDASMSSDPDGGPLTFFWDLDQLAAPPEELDLFEDAGWDTPGAPEAVIQHAWSAPGQYIVRVKVVDPKGAWAVGIHPVTIQSGEVAWHSQVIAGPSGAGYQASGYHTSLAVVAGHPAAAFSQRVGESLEESHLRAMFVRAQDPLGAAWADAIPIEESADLTVDHGGEIELRVVAGHPAICATRTTQGGDIAWDLVFERSLDPEGADWSAAATVIAPGGAECSMAMVDGHPALAWVAADGSGLWYARGSDPEGIAWGVPVQVDPPGVVLGAAGRPSLNVLEGTPAIAWTDLREGFDADRLLLSHLGGDGESWDAPMVISEASGLGDHNDLLDTPAGPCVGSLWLDDKVVIFLSGDPAGTLWDGAAWGAASTNGDVYVTGASMALVDEAPVLAWRRDNLWDAQLLFSRAATPDNMSWEGPELVAEVGWAFGEISAADVGGHPAAVYPVEGNQDVLQFSIWW